MMIMDLHKIYQAELSKISKLVELVKKDGKVLNPRYVCDLILAMTGNPYDFMCWHCSRQEKNYRIGVCCSWVKLGAKIGNGYSPLFGMTGLQLLEKMRDEVKVELKK